jgi:hypothetical protein
MAPRNLETGGMEILFSVKGESHRRASYGWTEPRSLEVGDDRSMNLIPERSLLELDAR